MSYWNAFAKKFPKRSLLRIDGGSIFETGTAQAPVVNRWILEGTLRSNLDAVNLTAWDLPAWEEMADMAADGTISKELLQVPLVSANVTPKALSFPPIQRYIIKEYALDGQPGRKARIGITGVLYDPDDRIPKSQFRIDEPQESVRRIIAQLRDKTDYRIVLTDTDVGKAISMAVVVPGINMIVVTHNYAAISEPQQVGDTLVVLPVNEGRILSEIRASFEPAANRVAVQARFVPLDKNVPDDPLTAEFLRKAGVVLENSPKEK